MGDAESIKPSALSRNLSRAREMTVPTGITEQVTTVEKQPTFDLSFLISPLFLFSVPSHFFLRLTLIYRFGCEKVHWSTLIYISEIKQQKRAASRMKMKPFVELTRRRRQWPGPDEVAGFADALQRLGRQRVRTLTHRKAAGVDHHCRPQALGRAVRRGEGGALVGDELDDFACARHQRDPIRAVLEKPDRKGERAVAGALVRY